MAVKDEKEWHVEAYKYWSNPEGGAPRTYSEVARRFKKSVGFICQLSKRMDWKGRYAARVEAARKKLDETIAQRRARIANRSRTIQDLAMKALIDEKGNPKLEFAKAEGAVDAFQKTARLELGALGEEGGGEGGDGRLRHVSDEMLDTMIEELEQDLEEAKGDGAVPKRKRKGQRGKVRKR